MKVISGVAAAGSGSLGRFTWSRNRSGAYIREKAVPVNPNTVFQQLMRSHFANLSTAWLNELTAVQREAWIAYALAVLLPDALGNMQSIGGNAMFIKCNAGRLQAGKTRIDSGPVILTLAELSAVTLTATGATDALSFGYVNSDLWATAVGGHLFLFASRPQSPSISSFKGPYRFVAVVNGAVVPPTSPIVVTHSFPFAAGDKIFFRAVASNADGRPSPDFRSMTTAV